MQTNKIFMFRTLLMDVWLIVIDFRSDRFSATCSFVQAVHIGQTVTLQG